MLPNPLHPAIVHFPIVLAVGLPLMAITALVLIWRGKQPAHAWRPVVLVAFALAASAWIAVETGQREEDTVEDVVAGSAIHEHEEAAEVFLPLTFVALGLVGLGLFRGQVGRVARPLSTGAAIILLGFGARVGASGGELVYEHGAASAYVSGGTQRSDESDRGEARRERRERDEHERGGS